MNTMRNLLTSRAVGLFRLGGRTDNQLFFGGDHFCHRKAWERKGNGMQEKAPIEDKCSFFFLYESVAQKLSTTSAGEPCKQVLDRCARELTVINAGRHDAWIVLYDGMCSFPVYHRGPGSILC